jgi:hypothetical protein
MKNNQNQQNNIYSIAIINPDDIDSHKLKNKENKHLINAKKADINILNVYAKRNFCIKNQCIFKIKN